MMNGVKIKELDLKKDERGSFVEIIRPEDLEGNKNTFGQISLTTANIGKIKGKHYHERKTEWFYVLKGNAKFRLVNKKNKEEEKVEASADSMLAIGISPFIWHSIENIGDEELHVLAYIDEPFNPEDPDTFQEEL